LVTLAPELPGAIDVVTALADRGVVVAAGHSLAGYTEAQVAIEAGISYSTHLFNAMASLHHRRPGLIGALLADERVTVGLIADGVHVHPALVKLVWQLVGNGRLNLVTDAMAALGMPAGAYPLGNFQVTVDGTSACLSDGTLAGSILSLDVALRNLMTFAGCSLAEALPAMTTTPFALLGLGQRKGQIAPGYDADFVLLTPDLTVICTIVAGQIVYQNNELLENGAISQEE
jgi:N-acetylglucosamine-6-phosphate deacetylase